MWIWVEVEVGETGRGKATGCFIKKMIFSKNKIEKENGSAWWHRTVIPALERLTQEDCGFEANMSKDSQGLSHLPSQQFNTELVLRLAVDILKQ